MKTRVQSMHFNWPVIASCAVVAATLTAIAAPSLIAPGDPLAVHPIDAFTPPSLAHPFGTDESGRDLFTRVVHGTRASVGIGVAATLIGAGIGALAGFAAGLGPKLADRAFSRLFEVLFALPTLVLALLFISIMGGGTASSVLAIGIATIPGYARMLRARVRGVAASDYVEWARLDGVSGPRVFSRHIAPNSLWPLASAATLGIGQAIIWVSALGFLGLGTAPPAPEWGAMLNAGRVYLTSAWWMTVFPGLAIVAIASALTVLGRAAGAPRTHRTRTRTSIRASGRAGSRAAARAGEAGTSAAVDRSAAPVVAPAAATATDTVTDTATAATAALSITDLSVSTAAGVPVLDRVSLSVAPGECLAIVGESGAGKSVLARTLLGLTQEAPEWRVSAASLAIAGTELRDASPRAWRRTRGTGVALVLQDALQSLDPLRTIEDEVGETLALRGVRGSALRTRVIAALEAAGLPQAASRLRQRPSELSGGMRQRALIASALVGDPALLIADEPTTALDPATSLRVQRLFRSIVDDGTSVVLISHDLASVARTADRIAVLERGRIVEYGAAADLLEHPQHPVTQALVEAIPRGPKPATPRSLTAAHTGEPLLQLRDATVCYPKPGGGETGMFGIDLTLTRGETLGLVGESGAGKSTLGRVIIGAEAPQQGSREFVSPGCRIRLIPQDPLASFDPRWRIERILRASIRIDTTDQAAAAAQPQLQPPTPAELLALVGLDAEMLRRYPAQLSGGQRQRVAIARALAASPDVLVCDEAVSALDVTTQEGVLNLLRDLQEQRGVTLVFISHDLAVVRSMADRIVVMRDGRIVEQGDTETVIATSQEPFTRALIEASELSELPAKAEQSAQSAHATEQVGKSEQTQTAEPVQAA